MSAYSIYVPFRSMLLRHAKSFVPKALRTRETADKMIADGMRNGQVSEILLENVVTEAAWLDGGSRMYFVVSKQVVQMLWDSKMDVKMEDLDLMSFPRAFSVAWPECEIDGVKLSGCIVGRGRSDELRNEMSDFYKERVGFPPGRVGVTTDSMVLSTYYWGEKEEDGLSWSGLPIIGGSLMEDIWSQCLSSDKDFERAFKDRLSFGCVPLNEKEMHQQYVMMKMLVRLMVYMKACPESVVSGFPEGKDARDFGCQKWLNADGQSVGWPGGTHASPSAHWRMWHFRSYPRRTDGTKRDGVVFVTGTVVGLEQLEPMRVEMVGQHKGG